MKIGIVTVAYFTSDAHVDLAKQSYESFKTNFETFKVCIVNCCRGDDDFDFLTKHNDKVLFNEENCLASAWNKGILECKLQGCDYIFIPNLDIVVSSLDALVAFAQDHTSAMVFSMHCVNGPARLFNGIGYYEVNHINSWDNYSAFMIRNDFVERLKDVEKDCKEPFPGMFDENIRPAYCEDVDMDYRLHLKGFVHMCVESAEFFHHRNATINFHGDKEWAQRNLSSEKTTPYIVSKWGGMRDTMHYLLPFKND